MNYTEAEIKLCRCLHELGVRPEIREGDWVIDLSSYENNQTLVLEPRAFNYIPNPKAEDLGAEYYRDDLRENKILLFTWKQARGWLRERGWRLTGHNDHSIEITCSFYNDKTLRDEFGLGQTDLEAILAVMVQVAEEEKP